MAGLKKMNGWIYCGQALTNERLFIIKSNRLN